MSTILVGLWGTRMPCSVASGTNQLNQPTEPTKPTNQTNQLNQPQKPTNYLPGILLGLVNVALPIFFRSLHDGSPLALLFAARSVTLPPVIWDRSFAHWALLAAAALAPRQNSYDCSSWDRRVGSRLSCPSLLVTTKARWARKQLRVLL